MGKPSKEGGAESQELQDQACPEAEARVSAAVKELHLAFVVAAGKG
jgi:hypothetical protein